MKRYSETISDELKDKVLRIKAQRVSDFKSCAFETMQDLGEELSISRWMRAQKDEDSDSWIVKEYRTSPYNIQDSETRATDLDKVPAKQRIIMHRACLMDALHACAAFETYERAKGKFPIGPEKEEMGLEHYQTAGEEEGIPVDLSTGLPVPTANGIIFSEDAELPALSKEFEGRSKGNLIAKDKVQAISAQDIIGRDLDVPLDFDNSERRNNEVRSIITSTQQLETQHKKIMQNMNKLSEVFNSANDNEFKQNTFLLKNPFKAISYYSSWLTLAPVIAMPSPLTIGMAFLPAVCSAISVIDTAWDSDESFSQTWRDNGPKFPMRKFLKQLGRVREDIGKLDSEEEKTQLLQTADKIELSAYAMRARYAFNEAANNDNWRNKRRMKRDLDRLEQKARSLGMPENDLNNLLLTLQKDATPRDSVKKYSYFENILKRNMRNEIESIEIKLTDLKTQQTKRLLAGPA